MDPKSTALKTALHTAGSKIVDGKTKRITADTRRSVQARTPQSRVLKSTTVTATTQTVQPNQPRKRRVRALTQTGERILDKRNIPVQKASANIRAAERVLFPSVTENNQAQEVDIAFEGSAGSKKSALSKGYTLYKQVRAGQASVTIFWAAIPFWIPQLCFWAVGLVGLGGESIPVANWFIPGETILFVMNFLVMGIGLITMICAYLYYSVRLVDAVSGWKGIIFCFCVAFYCAPILNFIPWFIPWIVATTYLQGND